ncbi:transposable element Tcb1 transposase [Trichonephila clavipes]|nr:transposable element Tcb1 transposase [Trichonephila clavipes]
MGAEFLFIDDNAHPHHANIVDECLQSEDITRMNWPAYSPDFNPIEHVSCTNHCPNCPNVQLSPQHILSFPEVQTRLFKINPEDPEDWISSDKAVEVAEASFFYLSARHGHADINSSLH